MVTLQRVESVEMKRSWKDQHVFNFLKWVTFFETLFFVFVLWTYLICYDSLIRRWVSIVSWYTLACHSCCVLVHNILQWYLSLSWIIIDHPQSQWQAVEVRSPVSSPLRSRGRVDSVVKISPWYLSLSWIIIDHPQVKTNCRGMCSPANYLWSEEMRTVSVTKVSPCTEVHLGLSRGSSPSKRWPIQYWFPS